MRDIMKAHRAFQKLNLRGLTLRTVNCKKKKKKTGTLPQV